MAGYAGVSGSVRLTPQKPAAGAVVYTLSGGHRTYAPRDEAPVHFQYATLTMCNITATQPTTTLCPVHMAGRNEPTTAANQEQQLFMLLAAPAPSPPRFATAREDVEARRGAGPPCTFRYARPILIHRQNQKKPPPLGRSGDSGRSVPLYPPWGSNPPLRDGRGACCPLYYDKIQQLGTVPLSHTARLLSRCNTKTLATALDTPCGPPLMAGPLPPRGPVGTGAVGGVPAGPGWPAHLHAHSPPPQYDYTHGARGWGLLSHPPLPEAGAIGQSSKKDDPATSIAGGSSGYHHTHTCCLLRPAVPAPSEPPGAPQCTRTAPPCLPSAPPLQGQGMYVHRARTACTLHLPARACTKSSVENRPSLQRADFWHQKGPSYTQNKISWTS